MPDRLVVLNKDEDSVSIVDPESETTETKIETDFNPHEVAISPDGSETYVTCSLGNRVNVIDNDTFEVVERLDHDAFEFPHGLAVRESADELWMASTYSSQIFVIDLTTNQIEDVFPTYQDLSHMVAVAPDETTGYVANIGSDSVSVIDLDSRSVTATFPVGKKPEGIAVHQDTGQIYVANQDDGTLWVVDSETYETEYELTLGTTPIRVVVSPDGRHVLIPNRESDDLSIVDTQFSRDGQEQPWEVKRLPVGVWPGGTVFSDDGSKAYVANNKTNDVSVIDMDTLEETGRIDVGIHPDGIAYLSR